MVSTTPILELIKRGFQYSVYKDSSSYQMGAALFKTYTADSVLSLGLWRKNLNFHEKNYSISEKYSLAVVWTLTTIRRYFIFEDFFYHTAQSNHIFLINVSNPSVRLIRWGFH